MLSKLECYSIEEKLNFSQSGTLTVGITPIKKSVSSATKSTGTVSKSDLREDAPEFHPNYHKLTGYDLFNMNGKGIFKVDISNSVSIDSFS